MYSVTVECFASAMNPGMAFFAHDLNVVALIGAAILHLNDVMRLKRHHWLQ
jgi:hypothetical protein